MVAGPAAEHELAVEEIFAHAVGHALDLAEWFGEESILTEVIGRDERVVGVAMFENRLGMFQLFEIGFGWDRVTDGHDVVPFLVGDGKGCTSIFSP